MKKGLFISLKWKIAMLIGSVFLLLHSTLSYFLYLDINEDFVKSRQNRIMHNQNTVRTLTKESFLVLDQFADLFSVIHFDKPELKNMPAQIGGVFDKNWQQWQFIWGLENAVFFDANGSLVQQWGVNLLPKPSTVLSVLQNESPEYQILCRESCFQFVMIPVMEDSKLIGVFGVSRSFADIVIKYKQMTGADIAVLVSSKQSPLFQWPYKVSAITNATHNKAMLNVVAEDYLFSDFLNARKVINYQRLFYEMSVFPIETDKQNGVSPYYMIVEDITDALLSLDANLKTIWLYGVISLFMSLALLLVVLFFSLRRVNTLSEALPLLAKQRYSDFRQIISDQTDESAGYDELDLLSHTALKLSFQLEGLEKEVKESICKLIEQGQDLITERDFNQQLINVAPIIVIAQDKNGIILSVNQAGIDEFAMEESLITGSVFDNFIPDSEIDHLARLKKLRDGNNVEKIKVDGILLTNQEQQCQISWIHTVVKPIRDQKASYILSLGVDISERKLIEEKMLKMATHDQLTGMSNRRYFQKECLREINLASRYKTQLALFYLDLDQFKVVNDTSGHEAGDKLLILVAKSLQHVVRGTDILSRIGGDEFTLIMPNVQIESIENVAKKINESLMAIDFWVEDQVYKISTSIGIAIYPQHGSNVDELLSNADLAMYQAKQSGYGQFHIFSPEKDYQSRLSSRLFWKDIIEDALQNDRFVVLYEPILDVKANEISYFECLIRIKTAEGHLLMPGDFISYAEELGLIDQIDRIVIAKVIELHKKLNSLEQRFKLSLNLSGRSVNDAKLFQDIADMMNSPDVDAEQFVFEITEAVSVSNFIATQNLIKKINSLGCACTLDDFGSSFSSFYYLKYLPVDYVKIDSSFIRNLNNNFEEKVFVKALIEVLQTLGKKATAEYVENEAVFELLKELGIDYVQGHHIGKPDVFESYLATPVDISQFTG